MSIKNLPVLITVPLGVSHGFILLLQNRWFEFLFVVLWFWSLCSDKLFHYVSEIFHLLSFTLVKRLNSATPVQHFHGILAFFCRSISFLGWLFHVIYAAFDILGMCRILCCKYCVCHVLICSAAFLQSPLLFAALVSITPSAYSLR